MLSIQDVGLEILNNSPRNFYVFLGVEYGIKLKYIDLIAKHYGADPVSVESVDSILSMMNTKRLIPLQPKVYVVHYDESFLACMNKETMNKIKNTKIVGTIICIYESEAAVKKISSNLPDVSVLINSVDSRFIYKYLKSDFPVLSDRILKKVSTMSSDYFSASNVCKCIDAARLYDISDTDIDYTFKNDFEISDSIVKIMIASRNFKGVLDSYYKYSGTPDLFIYNIFNVLLELEKLIINKYAESDLKPYVKRWKLSDIYNMFNQTYRVLNQLRTITSDYDNCIVYLASLLLYSDIPSIEEI